MYEVFTRTWWRENPDWPDGLEPFAGDKTFLYNCRTEEEAMELCAKYNENHPAGRFSRKAEYQERK